MKPIQQLAIVTLAAASISSATSVYAYNVLDIATEPLGTGTGLSVKPNLWFILDDSGSMDSTFTPDYVNTSLCQRDMSSFGSTYSCTVGDAPYMASGFNKSYYNPAITYTPPVDASGASLGNMDPAKAKGEPFRYPNSSSSSTKEVSNCMTTDYTGIGSSGDRWCNLTTAFPHRWYCDSNATNDDTHCRKPTTGTPFAYPNTTYRYNDIRTTYGGPYYFVMSGAPVWCTNANLTSCPGKKWSSATPYPRFSGGITINGTRAAITFTVDSTATGQVTKIVADEGGADEVVLFNGTINASSNSRTNRNNLANAIVAAINGVGNFSASNTTCPSGSSPPCLPVVTVTAPGSTTATSGNDTYNNKPLNIYDNQTGISFTLSNGGNFSGGANYQGAFAGVTFTRVDILSSVTSGYAIDPATGNTYATRTDCGAISTSGCSYTQELQNFANWFSYYRGRLLMTKSAISIAFKDVSDSSPGIGFRVGFSVISQGTSDAQGTELAIGDFNTSHRSTFYSKLFSIYPNSWTPLRTALSRAGQIFAGQLGTDPMQYTCQQNYTFLATDGYWNTNIEPNTNFNMTMNGTVGNVDISTTTNAPYKDALDKSNTLADIARYYYINDLRSTDLDDVPKASNDETIGTKMWQHMKTFTMGLGVDGNLAYCPSYLAGCSADYNTIVGDGGMNWGNPIDNTSADRIDDLWHAAVNGHGQYFSASDPNEVGDAIAKTLAAAEQMSGAAAAAATSNLEPVAGDNYAYVASYTTNVWDGNLEAKTINLSTGELSGTSVWSARDQLDTKANTGGRTLYTYDGLLTWSSLTTTEQGYFNPEQMTVCNPIANCPGATAQKLFEFVIGMPDATTNSDFRDRTHALGDIVNSQPVFIRGPVFNYTDTGYDSYKSANQTRQGMVYVGANDGFLHAFNADNGSEAWAYAPQAVLSNLWKLADPAYIHTYYVDGTLTGGDVKSGTQWKTILVGGMNKGGKYYYAWDVTIPSSPTLLWEFTHPDMGYAYGNPIITKLSNGTWVVLLTSGYNNTTGTSGASAGKGYLFVLDAISGTLIKRFTTNSGSATAPSGLAKVNNWLDDPMANNTTKYVYGGDLNGDIWRFNLDDADGSTAAKLASIGEPVTTRPELAEVKYKRIVIFGTGLFLQEDDRTDHALRGIYAIKDEDTVPATALGKTDLVQQSFSGGGSTRTLSSNAVEWTTDNGWYIMLPDTGERVTVDPKIQLGTLVVASNVPTTTGSNTCTVGGYAWLNYIDFSTGSDVKNRNGQVIHPSEKLVGALAVGINIVRLPDGKVVAITTTADNRHPVTEVPTSGSTSARRISWRELTTN